MHFPEDDLKTWELISSGKTKGCFQIESFLGKSWCREIKPKNIQELADVISLIRPGTLKAFVDGKCMTKHYADRKNGIDEVTSLHPLIDDIVENTYGIIVYQEQAMKIAQRMALFSLVAADHLRKAIGKKKADLMKKVRTDFIEGCTKNNIPEDESGKIFDIIEKSARYSFNAAHAVGYAKLSYASAYLKTHDTKKFFLHKLRNAKDKVNPDLEKKQLILDAKSFNIETTAPQFQNMCERFTLIDDKIVVGVSDVKFVGKTHYQKIKELSKCNPKTWHETLFKICCEANKRTIENLINVGFFSDSYPISRSQMLHDFTCSQKLTKKELEFIQSIARNEKSVLSCVDKLIQRGTKKNGGAIASNNRLLKVKGIFSQLSNPGRKLEDNPIILSSNEERLIGCAISCSELDSCDAAVLANTKCREVADGKMSKSSIAAVIKKCKIHRTKNGDEMAFLSVEDDSGELENIVVFPDVYEEKKALLYEESTVLITGEIKDRTRKSFIVESVYNI